MPDSALTYGRDFGRDFQKHALAVLWRVPGVIRKYRSALDSNYFSDEMLRLTARALLEYADEYPSLPTVDTLLEKIRPNVNDKTVGTVEKLLRELSGRDVSDHDAVEDMLLDFGKTQAMVSAVLTAGDKIAAGKIEDVRPLIEEATKVGEDAMESGHEVTADFERLKQYVDSESEMLHRVPTGLVHLDGYIDGGTKRGTLNVMLALAKTGKSTALINVGFGAVTSLDGYNVVHFTCEMSAEQVMRRYDDRLAGPNVLWRRKKPEQYRELLERRIRRFYRGRLIVYDYPPRALSPSMINTKVSQLITRGFIPDVVVVDYADEMRADTPYRDRRDAIDDIYSELRATAVNYDVVMWTASQAPQSAHHEGVELLSKWHFSESAGKGMKLDLGFSINQTSEEFENNKCRGFLFANRDGIDQIVFNCVLDRRQCSLQTIGVTDDDAGGGARQSAGPHRRRSSQKKRVKSAVKKIKKKPGA